jgi:hypothetical protein
MRLHFLGSFDVADYQRLGVTKSDDLLILRYPELYRDKIRAEMRKIVDKNAKNLANGKEPVELDVSIDIHYVKRSVDQNSWLWMAHTLEANIVNGHKSAWTDEQKVKWREAGGVTPEMIHDDYMDLYAPRGYIEVEPGFVDAVRKMLEETMGKVRAETWLPEKQKMQFEVWKTSSYMNVAEFCQLAEKVETQLLSYGIDLNTGADYKNLLADFDTWKREAEKKEGEANVPQSDNSVDTLEPEIPILTLKKDPVKIVTEVFKRTQCK